MDPCGERSDKRFQFLHGVLAAWYGSCTVAGLEKCRDPQRWHVWCVPRLRGTISGCLSHTKVFHTVGVVRTVGQSLGPVWHRLLTLDDHYHRY